MRFILILLILATSCRAATYYVTQAGAGSRNGTSLGNAWSVSDLNAPSSYTGGDTVRLEGTITSQVTIQHGGSAGNILTILFGTGAKLSSPAWSTTGALLIYANQSYITVDGGATGIIGGPNGNASFVNGVIECTDNGTALGNQVDSRGIVTAEQKFFTVKNLAIYNIYVRTSTTDLFPDSALAICNPDSGGSGVHDCLYTNLLIHDAVYGVSLDYGVGDTNYEVSFVTAYNCNWGGGCGDRGVGCTLSGLLVHDNWFYEWTNWRDTVSTPDPKYHNNGFYAFAESGGVLTNPKFYRNKFGPGFGGAYQTAGIFVSCQNISGTVNGSEFYDNLFVPATGESASNGLITFGTKAGTSLIYNNTFSGGVGQALRGGGTTDIQNNIFTLQSGTAIAIDLTATLTSSHNLAFNLSAVTPFATISGGSDTARSVAAWQGLGYDTALLTSDPNLNGSYVPQSGSAVISAGSDQSAHFTTDYAGVTWAGGTGWGIGALKASGSGSTGGSSMSGKISLLGKVTIK